MQEKSKVYNFIVKWGEETSTDDLEGQVVYQSSNRPKKSEIISILPNFRGKIQQTPPKFSALKYNGIRAYKLARQNIDFKLPKRFINVDEIKLTKILSEDTS